MALLFMCTGSPLWSRLILFKSILYPFYQQFDSALNDYVPEKIEL